MDFGSRSMHTTSPEGPTRRAASIATSPTPDPRSRTRCPSPMPASRKNLSVMGATRAACRIRRSCSAAVLPNGYLAERWLIVIVTRDVTSFDFISQYPYLFASDNGNDQNFGGASVPIYTDGASLNLERRCKLLSNSN